MKKLVLVLTLLFVATNLFAGDARVATMGGNTGLLPDDDSNIGLFPQRVNDWNILRIQDIGGDYNDYLLTTGEKGKKWAFYGSSAEENYLFNVIKSLSPTSAIDVGVQFMMMNGKLTQGAVNSELKASSLGLGVNLTLGMDMGSSEMAIGAFFGHGPNAYITLPLNPIFDQIYYGKIETYLNDVKQSEAKAGATAIGAGVVVRSPMNFFIFDQLFHGLYFNTVTATGEAKVGGTKMQDNKDADFFGAYQVFFFKNQAIAPEGLFKGGLLMYGLGFNIGYGTNKTEDLLSTVTNQQTYKNMWIGGPSLRIGLETAVKCAKLRFGIQRDIRIYESINAKNEVGNTEDEISGSEMGYSGSLYINSGLGFEMKNLKIDIILNSNVWRNGPQMILNDTYGDLSFQTDITYTFPHKEK